MDEDYDAALEKFLHSDVNSLYVKAESVDVRMHLISMFGGMVESLGAEPVVDELRKLEQYIKYG